MTRTMLPARSLCLALTAVLCVQPLGGKIRPQAVGRHMAAAPLLDAHAKTADQLVAPGTTGVTLREVVHVSIGGEMVRVRFSNLYGTGPLVIGAAQIAQTLKGAAVVPGSGKPLTFHGQTSVSIPAGALLSATASRSSLLPLPT